MICDKKMFDLLKQAFGPDCYDAKGKLEWNDTQPILTLNGKTHPVMRETWYNLAQTSNMDYDCISCLSSIPLEVVVAKLTNPANPIYILVAVNIRRKDRDECGYNYAPAVVEAMTNQ